MELPEVKPVLERDFVICWVDTDRTIGGAELLKKVRGSERGGIPWFAFLEPDGRKVATSDTVLGANLGCPHTEEEVEAWGETLRRARLKITDEEIARVVAAFHEAGARGEARRKAEKEAAAGKPAASKGVE